MAGGREEEAPPQGDTTTLSGCLSSADAGESELGPEAAPSPVPSPPSHGSLAQARGPAPGQEEPGQSDQPCPADALHPGARCEWARTPPPSASCPPHTPSPTLRRTGRAHAWAVQGSHLPVSSPGGLACVEAAVLFLAGPGEPAPHAPAGGRRPWKGAVHPRPRRLRTAAREPGRAQLGPQLAQTFPRPWHVLLDLEGLHVRCPQ